MAESTQATNSDEDLASMKEHSGKQPSSLLWGVPAKCSEVTFQGDPRDYILYTIFGEFRLHARLKLKLALVNMAQYPDTQIVTAFQHGSDEQFDKLISSLSSLASTCLPTLLKVFSKWRQNENDDMQCVLDVHQQCSDSLLKAGVKDAIHMLSEAKTLTLYLIYCRVVVEVLNENVSKLPVTTATDLQNFTFGHFLFSETVFQSQSATNRMACIDIMAEVIGVLSRVRFDTVTKRFLKELQTTQSSAVAKALVRGMTYIHIRLFPMESLEVSCKFMSELIKIFQELKIKEIKLPMLELFVGLLVPVAAIVKSEVNVPCFRSFVELLYSKAYDMSKKSKYQPTGMLLVCSILNISRKQFFLDNWHNFLSSCLSNMRHKDPNMQKGALNSIYRLMWVYVYRIKCESNQTTSLRLRSVTDVLFPKNSRWVMPKDVPLDVFVNILRFIARARLDFAIGEVVYDLFNVNGAQRSIVPERVDVGLRTFVMVADELELKDGSNPEFPYALDMIASNISQRSDEKPMLKTLMDEDLAREVGLGGYYKGIIKTLGETLVTLDLQVGRPLLMTLQNVQNRSFSEILTKERQPYLDAFKTCISSIPRFIPSNADLIDMLSRMTVHIDNELRSAAFTSLKNFIIEHPHWRERIIVGFESFIVSSVPDASPLILEGALRMLTQLISLWRVTVIGEKKVACTDGNVANLLEMILRVEGLGMIMLCSCRPVTRKLALVILKEIADLEEYLPLSMKEGKEATKGVQRERVIRIIERDGPEIIIHLYNSQQNLRQYSKRPADMSFFSLAGVTNTMRNDCWPACLALLFRRICSYKHEAAFHLWPNLCKRLLAIHQRIENTHIDTSKRGSSANLSNEIGMGSISMANISSRITGTISRNLHTSGTSRQVSSAKKHASDIDLALWQNYLTLSCCTVRVPDCSGSIRSSNLNIKQSRPVIASKPLIIESARELFGKVLPLLKSDKGQIRDAIVFSLGHINSRMFYVLIEELLPYIEEVLRCFEKKDVKRRVDHKLFLEINRIVISAANSLKSASDSDLSELFSSISLYLSKIVAFLEKVEKLKEVDFDDCRYHFCMMISTLIDNITCEKSYEKIFDRNMRYQMFCLFSNWSGYDIHNRQLYMCRNGVLSRRTGSEKSTADDGDAGGRKDDISDVGSSLTELLLNAEGTRRSEKSESELVQLSKNLHKVALDAMVHLCKGLIFIESAFENQSYLFKWLNMMLSSPNKETSSRGSKAVRSLLEGNYENAQLFSLCLEGCFDTQDDVADGYFQAFAEVFDELKHRHEKFIVLLHLTIFKAADSKQIVRKSAIDVLRNLCIHHNLFAVFGDFWNRISMSILSSSYVQSQLELSALFAKNRNDIAGDMVAEMCARASRVSQTYRRCILQYMRPWVAELNFPDPDIEPSSNTTLNNLFFLSCYFSSECCKEMEDIWVAFNRTHEHIHHTIAFLLKVSMIFSGKHVAPHCKRVIACLGRTAPTLTIDILVSFFNGNCRGRPPTSATAPLAGLSTYVAPVEHLFPLSSNNRVIYKKSHIAISLLVEVATLRGVETELESHLGKLLHMLFLIFDSNDVLLLEDSQMLLVNLINALVINSSNGDDASVSEAYAVIEWLVEQEGRPLWSKERASWKTSQLKSYLFIEQFIQRILTVFKCYPSLCSEWAEVAMNWANSCASLHEASRSLQICRALKEPVSNQALTDTLARLAEEASDHRDEHQSYVYQIVQTLTALVPCLGTTRLLNFPQLFWCSIALLESNYEFEFSLAVRLLSSLVDSLHLSKSTTQASLCTALPHDCWKHQFPGIQSLLLKGLTSPVTLTSTLELISSLSLILTWLPELDPCPSRTMLNVFSLLPHLAVHFDMPLPEHKAIALNLAHVFKHMDSDHEESVSSLYKLFSFYSSRGDGTNNVNDHFVKYTLLSPVRADMLAENRNLNLDNSCMWINAVCEQASLLLPKNDFSVFTLLAEMLEKGSAITKRPILHIFESLLKAIDLKESPIGCDPFSYVMRFFSGDLWTPTMRVLEACVNVNTDVVATSDTLYDKHETFKSLMPPRPSCWKNPRECVVVTRHMLRCIVASSPFQPVLLQEPTPPTYHSQEEDNHDVNDLEHATDDVTNDTIGEIGPPLRQVSRRRDSLGSVQTIFDDVGFDEDDMEAELEADLYELTQFFSEGIDLFTERPIRSNSRCSSSSSDETDRDGEVTKGNSILETPPRSSSFKNIPVKAPLTGNLVRSQSALSNSGHSRRAYSMDDAELQELIQESPEPLELASSYDSPSTFLSLQPDSNMSEIAEIVQN